MTLSFRPALLLSAIPALALALAPLPAVAELLPRDAPAVGAPIEPSLAGRYLAGRYAQSGHDLAAAADLLGGALEADPKNPDLMQQTFMLNLGAGRIEAATDLAKRLIALGSDNDVAPIVLAVAGAKSGDFAGAGAALKGVPTSGINSVLVPLLEAWFALPGEGIEAAVTALAPLAKIKGLEPLYETQLGLIQDLAGHAAEADTAYQAAIKASEQPSFRMHELAGNFYQRQNRAADAKALYDNFAKRMPAALWLEALTSSLEAGAKAPPTVPDAGAGAAEALFDLATILNQEEADDAALAYLRLALHLRPDLAIAQVLLGDVLVQQERLAEAVDVYGTVSGPSPFAWQARRSAARELDELDRTDEAVAALKIMVDERPRDVDAAIDLGNIERAHERFAEAAAAYDIAVARLGEPQPRHWSLFYFRGVSRERNKDWAAAEPDFKQALALEPDQPYVLNYLAYSWVEQQQQAHYDEALAMLAKAVELRPDDGYIVDSLGWVYFRLGRHDKAVEYLERAVQLKPQDPVINDHLGDAYWRAGRKGEAGSQWRRALLFKPEPDRIQPIEAKIERGLDDSTDG
jgi:tetratricopeptide (TPR) repeat protein